MSPARRQILGLLLAAKTMQEVAALVSSMPSSTRKHMKNLRREGLIADAGPHPKFNYARLYLITDAGKEALTGGDLKKPWYQSVSKPCEVCEEVFRPKGYVSRASWEKTKTCGKPTCKKVIRQNPRPERRKSRTCENCLRDFYIETVDGVWRIRKTCCDNCENESRAKKMKQSAGRRDSMKAPRPEKSHIYMDKTITVAEVMAKILTPKEDLRVTEVVGPACTGCGAAGASPYTGVCSTCYVKRNWQQGSQEAKIKPSINTHVLSK
jgi:hypothetical protein